jgi:hypothetical protein
MRLRGVLGVGTVPDSESGPGPSSEKPLEAFGRDCPSTINTITISYTDGLLEEIPVIDNQPLSQCFFENKWSQCFRISDSGLG